VSFAEVKEILSIPPGIFGKITFLNLESLGKLAIVQKNIDILQIRSYISNMQGYINRKIETILLNDLKYFPAVALLGPRQCGKSTLALNLTTKIDNFLYLDLESNADLRKLEDPELFFSLNLDLILEKGNEKIAIEFKASSAPIVGKGFWSSLEELHIPRAWVIALVDTVYPIKENVYVSPL